MEDMVGHRPNWYWKIMWKVVSPLLLLVVITFYIVGYIQGGTPTYHAWKKELVSFWGLHSDAFSHSPQSHTSSISHKPSFCPLTLFCAITLLSSA